MKLTAHQRLILFIIAAFLLDYLPLVNLPFLWSETFFHEISHGLASILTGGRIHEITLNFDGSGLCTTSGGIHFMVSFAGYAGSALWGLLIYRVADSLSVRQARVLVMVFIGMFVVTLALWARNMPTIIILLILLAMYILPLYFSLKKAAKYFIQLVGVFVLLDAIRSPLYLLDGRNLGDGATLAKLSYLPEIFWISCWFVIAIACLYNLWATAKRRSA
ncbi:hypothetical protein MNBD_GAMMA11-2013 [hydrothermal vent metagenome]|uniref:M50 family peptidase n=1 Tax=hydrothermal vent metagenome TaxID=652676 RepID=A0A3B0X8W3_9ZZZZ